MKVTNIDDLKKLKEGEVIELPDFEEGTPFNAKVRRLSLLHLAKAGKIPNELLGAARELFEGATKSNLKNYADVIDIVIEIALVEPTYDDVKELLTDEQRIAIYNYTQLGVRGLLPFRKIKELNKSLVGSKQTK
jgi:hypothetical protein